MSTLTVPDDVRDVMALSDDALDERRGLPAIAALRAASLVLRRAILSEMKAVRSAGGLHKTLGSLSSAVICATSWR